MADRKLSELTVLDSSTTDLTIASGDKLPVLDVSETASDAEKNKTVTVAELLKNLPYGSLSSPSLGFTGDSNRTGFYRSASDEIAVSVDGGLTSFLNSKFTSTGFQVGSGTATAKFHVFSNQSGGVEADDVIIEGTSQASPTVNGPNFILYRNLGSTGFEAQIGKLEFRSTNSAGTPYSYAEIVTNLTDATNTSEDSRLDIKTSVAGQSFVAIRLEDGKMGVGESAPVAPLHVSATETEILRLECSEDDNASGADITLYRHRNSLAGVDGDELSTLFFRGHNDDTVEAQRQIDYAAVQAQIADASLDTEDGRLVFQVQAAGTLTTQVEIEADKIEFFQDVDLASGKEFKINGASILNATTLGSSVVSSSLTSVGTIGTGTWNGTEVGVAYGGTGLTTAPAANKILIGNGTGYDLKTLTAGTNVTFSSDADSLTISASGTGGSTNTAGDGIDIVSNEISVDLKANGGLVIESTELALDLGATSITGTLPTSKLDGVTATGTELSTLDGDTAATATTLAATDRIVVNDGGTMVQVALSDLVTFLENGTASSLDIDGGTY